MKESKCYKLIQHSGGHKEWENVVAVSHNLEKLQKTLKMVNTKGWKVLSDSQWRAAHLETGNYFAIAPVSYL